MPHSLSPNRRNSLKPETLRLVMIGGILATVLGVLLLVILVRPKPPRIFGEVVAFQNRVHEGLELLCQDRHADPDILSDGDLLDLEVIRTDPDSERVFRREWRWALPSKILPPGDLKAFSDVLLEGWPVPGAYPTRGHGGGGQRFGLSFGDSRSYAGVLMTAFEQKGTTQIHMQTMAVAAPIDDTSASGAVGEAPGADVESLDRFRQLFTAELGNRCEAVAAPPRNSREKSSGSFDRPGSSYTGSGIREHEWRWVVPEGALKPESLRRFAEEIRTRWDAGIPSADGKDNAFSLSFGNGRRQAFVNVIAIPRRATKTGESPQTVIYYHQVLFDGASQAADPPPDAASGPFPINHEALLKVPGSSARERLASAGLDGDGRMLKALRERDRLYAGTWKIEYNLRLSAPLPEELVERFASSHGMTWEAKSTRDPRRDEMRHYLRFFRVTEFSEDDMARTTSSVHQFAEEHEAVYIGWNFKSDKIRQRRKSEP